MIDHYIVEYISFLPVTEKIRYIEKMLLYQYNTRYTADSVKVNLDAVLGWHLDYKGHW